MTTRLLNIAEYKEGSTNRKAWEVEAAGWAILHHLNKPAEAEVLGVGAGVEPTGYYLSAHVKRVFMTDLYGDAGAWVGTAPKDVLVQPAFYAPDDAALWNPRRLVVQHMDMRELRYEDASFDAVYSSGSIEHLPSWDDIAVAAQEIGRVLKPGGMAAISTEWKLAGEGDGWPGVFLFDRARLEKYLVAPSGLALVGGDDLTVDATTLATAWPLADIVLNGDWPPVEGVLTHAGFTFTSIFVLLVKPEKKRARSGK